ncbi:MAG: hypothetical protein ACT4OF_16210 [Caulobacteraceae bacterium]
MVELGQASLPSSANHVSLFCAADIASAHCARSEEGYGWSMRAITFAIIAIALTSAAAAQAPMVFVPTFDAEPSSAELISRYPPAALQQNTSGIAVLCCTPRPDRSVACAVSSEWPAAHGFGDASVRASRSYRLSADSYADLIARPGTSVRISLIWAGPVILPATIDELRRIDGETMHACLTPVQSEAPTN